MFRTEAELQTWLAEQLRRRGDRPQLEVITHPRALTRADIVVGDTVIECKKILDRDRLHGAYGQGVMYRSHLNKSHLVLIGMPPYNQADQQTAQRAALALQTADRSLSCYWVNSAGIIPIGERRASALDKLERVSSVAPLRRAYPLMVSIGYLITFVLLAEWLGLAPVLAVIGAIVASFLNWYLG